MSAANARIRSKVLLGFSLIEALLAVAISGIVISLFSSIMLSQQRQIQYFEAKQESLDVKNSLVRIFGAGTANLCPAVDVTYGDLRLDKNSTESELKFKKIIESLTDVYANADEKRIKNSPRISLTGMSFKSITALIGNTFRANLVMDLAINGNSAVIKSVVLPDVTLQTIQDPINANKLLITGCAVSTPALNPFGDVASYPSGCYLELGHQDGAPSGLYRSVRYQTSRPGYMGISLTGDVDSNDLFYIGGGCNFTDPKSLEAYFSKCHVDIGIRDGTESSAFAANSAPSRFTFGFMDKNLHAISLTGNVDANDSFYFRTLCPTPTAEQKEAATYLKSSCYVCFGESDLYGPTPDRQVCRPITADTETSWSRFKMLGNVNYDDVMFIGFYCKNPSDNVYGIVEPPAPPPPPEPPPYESPGSDVGGEN